MFEGGLNFALGSEVDALRETLRQRREAHEAGAWVREAALAHAEKRRRRAAAAVTAAAAE